MLFPAPSVGLLGWDEALDGNRRVWADAGNKTRGQESQGVPARRLPAWEPWQHLCPWGLERQPAQGEAPSKRQAAGGASGGILIPIEGVFLSSDPGPFPTRVE